MTRSSRRRPQSQNDDDDDHEWNANDGSLNDDLEHIYAREIEKYNSDASSESEEEDSGDEFFENSAMEGRNEDDDHVEYSSDEFETWVSQQKAKKANKKRKRRKEEASTYDNDDDDENLGDIMNSSRMKKTTKKVKKKTRVRQQKIRCRRRFQDMKPFPMPDLEEKQEILDKIKTADFTSVGNYEEMEAWSEAEVYLCKFIQCTLWDCNFRYTLLPHQFVAVITLAGINVINLLDQMSNLKEDYETLVNLEKTGKKFRKYLCIQNVTFVETRGILLADAMGLGKTVSSIAAAILRNYIFKLKSYEEDETKRAAIDVNNDKKVGRMKGFTEVQKQKIFAKLPTLISGPNDAVLDQWEETLILAGVDPNKIIPYSYRDDNVLAHVDHFVLLTRHQMMSEMRNLIETKSSNLFPNFPLQLLKVLENVYKSSKGRGKIKNLRKGETGATYFTRVMESNMNKLSTQPLFRTFLIDEAHFLKNLECFWGMFATCLGAVTDETIPLTGTPFNNANQDMASLMTFINPRLEYSKVEFWDEATDQKSADTVIENIDEWRRHYVIRRDKSVLEAYLPKKFVTCTDIRCYMSELCVYQYYEEVFRKVFKQFTQLSETSQNLIAKRRRMEKFTIMMASMTCMRMSLIHPMIPRGREATIQFSPSRRNDAATNAGINADLKEECVVCERYPAQKDLSEEAMEAVTNDGPGGLHNPNGDEADIDDANFDSTQLRKKKTKYKRKSPLVEVPRNICSCSPKFKHFVHECCMEKLKDECPRCSDLHRRVNFSAKCSSNSSKTYCQEISVAPGINGFQSTTKIDSVITWIKEIPDGEKAILYSFFKSSLDLFEGILVHDLGYECARFDGDVDPYDRSKELQRFKQSANCRVLLATVQSSGTGLNIVEANHIGFIDRWFNPCVHSQAEDRCHRFKQKRDVHINYFDNSATVDQVMKVMNEKKTVNGSILLADGMNIGVVSGGLTFQELSGIISLLMSGMYSHRNNYFMRNPSESLDPLTDAQITDMLENAKNSRKNGDKKETGNTSSEETTRATEARFENPNLESTIPPPPSPSKLCAFNNNDDLSLESDGTIEIFDDDDVEMDTPDTTKKSPAATLDHYTNSLDNDTNISNICGTNLKADHGFTPTIEKKKSSDEDDLPSPGLFTHVFTKVQLSAVTPQCLESKSIAANNMAPKFDSEYCIEENLVEPSPISHISLEAPFDVEENCLKSQQGEESSSSKVETASQIAEKGVLKDVTMNSKVDPGILKNMQKKGLETPKVDLDSSDDDDDDLLNKPGPFSQTM